MEPIIAKSREELFAILKSIDISVPLRTEGRTTEHCEKWSICRFLATFADSEFTNFPIIIIHRDRPDFLLQNSSIEAGIEVTEVVSQIDAAIDAYREIHDIDGLFFIKHHRPGEPRLRGKDLKNEAISEEPGDGWEGNSVEHEWVQAVKASIHDKNEKSKKKGFQLFEENWLLMYDNWSLPALNQEMAARILFDSMEPEEFGPFVRIFVECSKHIWTFSPLEFYPKEINELWSGS
jgi:hypothetical protein